MFNMMQSRSRSIAEAGPPSTLTCRASAASACGSGKDRLPVESVLAYVSSRSRHGPVRRISTDFVECL
jgi:hypothetical protein